MPLQGALFLEKYLHKIVQFFSNALLHSIAKNQSLQLLCYFVNSSHIGLLNFLFLQVLEHLCMYVPLGLVLWLSLEIHSFGTPFRDFYDATKSSFWIIVS